MATQYKNIVDIVMSWPKRAKSAGVTYSSLADAIGVAPMTTYRWFHYEKHGNLPALKKIDQVEKYLKSKGV